MKTNALFEECVAKVPNDIKIEIDLSFDISARIDTLLIKKGLSQKDFAAKMGKKESEVSKWLQGTHNFTLKTIAKISDVLGENIIQVVGIEKEQRIPTIQLCVCKISPEREVNISLNKKGKDTNKNIQFC